jgi:hypothetical protein
LPLLLSSLKQLAGGLLTYALLSRVVPLVAVALAAVEGVTANYSAFLPGYAF